MLRTRPLCPHPHVANYKGSGSTNDASNFVCGQQVVQGKAVLDSERCAFKANERVFGVPFVPSGRAQDTTASRELRLAAIRSALHDAKPMPFRGNRESNELIE